MELLDTFRVARIDDGRLHKDRLLGRLRKSRGGWFLVGLVLLAFQVTVQAGETIRTNNEAARCDAIYRHGKLAIDCPYQMAGVMFLKITRATNIEFSVPSKIAKSRASVVLPPMPLKEAMARLLEPYNFVWTENDSAEVPFPSVAILGTKQLSSDTQTAGLNWNAPAPESAVPAYARGEMEDNGMAQPRIGRAGRVPDAAADPAQQPAPSAAPSTEAPSTSSGLSFSSVSNNASQNGWGSNQSQETTTPPEARDKPTSLRPEVDPSITEQNPLPASP